MSRLRIFLLVLACAPMFVYGGVKGYAYFTVRSQVQEMIRLVSPFVEVSYGGIGSSFDGTFSVEDVWQSNEFRADVNTAVLANAHIYGFDRGTLKSLDAATGEVRWKARGFQRGSLIAVDGRLIILGERGTLALVAATPEKFVQHSSAPVLHGRNWTMPTLADGRLYLRNQEEIVCVDMRRPKDADDRPFEELADLLGVRTGSGQITR